ncbi:tyrosine-type recombinase/integrase [Pseudoalteromonas piscicida]|nr:tyrosine-type recombinase/integrase [Pseudoalteromonas piscicida]
MLDNGADLRHIQKMLGHASIFTIQRYTHISRKKSSEVMKQHIPRLLKQVVCFELLA